MSQITSSAANAAGAPAPDPPVAASGEDAAARFEGMLFSSALAPLSQAIGVLGDELVNAVATEVARGSHDEFYRRLQTLVDADRPT